MELHGKSRFARIAYHASPCGFQQRHGYPRLFCLGIAVLWNPLAVLAAGPATETIVVTASRLDQSTVDLTQSIEFISQDEIDRLWAASATEVLRQIPGTNVIQQGGRGGTSSILLRGGEPNFTAVFIDGVQVNDPTNTRGGAYDIGNLEQAQISDVEIVFGPLSSLYGSDALSGAVNFITRGAGSGSDVSIISGTQGYESGSAFYGGTVAGVDTGVGVYATDDDGDVDGADYSSSGVHGKFAAALGDKGSAALSLGYQSVDSTSYPEDSGGPELAVLRALDDRNTDEGRAGLNLGYAFAEDWRADVFASYYSIDQQYSSPGIAAGVLDAVPPNSADTDFYRQQLTATASGKLGGNVTALLGSEWQNENGESTGEIDFGFPVPADFELDRDTVSAFAEASADFSPFVLQGAIRWDDPEDFSSIVTGRVGLLYKFADAKTELRANWGEGFKAPSFFALGNPLVGNPDLRPEKGESVDMGIKRRVLNNQGSVEFSVFRNEFDDLIDFDDVLFTNVNRDNVVTTGAEATGQLIVMPGLEVQAHVTYLDTDVKDSSDDLRGRPEWRGGAVVDWALLADWRWVTSVLLLGEFYESSIPTGEVRLDGYTQVNTAVTWQASESLSVGLAVDNLFANDYQEAVGFPAAGVRGRLGAKYSF